MGGGGGGGIKRRAEAGPPQVVLNGRMGLGNLERLGLFSGLSGIGGFENILFSEVGE